jgi:hypothetical protein
MPPIRNKNKRNSLEKEGRLILALTALKKEQITSIREVARQFEVPESTLRDRLRGRQPQAEIRANCHKLAIGEENTLVKWILDSDKRGLPPGQLMSRLWSIIFYPNAVAKLVNKKLVLTGFITLSSAAQSSNRDSQEDTITSVQRMKIRR